MLINFNLWKYSPSHTLTQSQTSARPEQARPNQTCVLHNQLEKEVMFYVCPLSRPPLSESQRQQAVLVDLAEIPNLL